MSVNVRFENSTQCERKDGNDAFYIYLDDNHQYSLPNLYLEPVHGNQPHISKLSLEAKDGPEPVLAMLANLPERSLQPLRKLEKTVFFRPPKLNPSMAIAGQCRLVVNVHYYDTDPSGNPVLTEPKVRLFDAPLIFSDTEPRRSAIGISRLPVTPGEFPKVSPPPLSASQNTPLKLRLQPPAPLIIAVNGEAAKLFIEVIGGSVSSPYMIVSELSVQDTDLRQHLQSSLDAATLVRLATTDNNATWEIQLTLRLPDTLKKRLFPSPDSPSLPVKITIKAGSAECEYELLLESEESRFAGWIALDFGTSSSTAILFNPKEGVPVHGLPHEQSQRLQRRVMEWLSQKRSDSLSGRNVNGDLLFEEWQQLLDDIGKSLANGTGFASVIAPFNTGDKAAMYNVLRQIELWLPSASSELQRAIHLELHKLYQEVLRVPPLKDQWLMPVELEEASGQTEILSEAQIEGLDPLRMLLGEKVRDARRAKVAEGEDTSGQFFQSLKRYLGTDDRVMVRVGTEQSEKSASELIQATFGKLLELTDAFRKRYPRDVLSGSFRRAIVTYPAVAPPTVRQDLERLLNNLNIINVKTDYDEAVSAAIFYLMREFGGDMSTGLEALKTRCRRRSDTTWAQNVMVLDIGGGTTDIALIQFTLEDKTPLEAATGSAGRYYVITPRLLGSSGHMQLGGDLATLHPFLLLKAALADRLLVKFGHQGGPLGARVNALDKPFVNEGRYVEGSLLAPGPEHAKARDAVEEVLPTRWKGPGRGSRLQTFQLLWDQAERAKMHLGQRCNPPAQKAPFVMEAATIRELLRHNTDFHLDSVQEEIDLAVSLDVDLFEKAVTPVIEEAVEIAKGLLESRLPPMEKNGKSRCEPLDWLILSGKSCQLSLVEQTIRRLFSKVDYFVWNWKRVTLVPEFAKIGTAIGACWAESLRRTTRKEQGSIKTLRKGLSLLYFDVKNLFFFLPCAFTHLITEAKRELVFLAGTELYQLDAEPVGRARSEWYHAVSQISVFRKDYNNAREPHWATFDADTRVTKKLGLADWELEEDFRYQLEIDYKLRLRIYLVRGKPHYMVSPDIPSLDVKQQEPVVAVEETGNTPTGHSLHTPSASTGKTGDGLFHTDGKLAWTIAIDVFPGGGQLPFSGVETVLFRLETR